MLCAVFVAGCGEAPAVPETPGPSARPAEEPPQPIEEARRERAAYVHSAQRCGECHESAFSGWEGSAHARSAESPAFTAMRARQPDRAGDCTPCHAPIAPWVPEGDPIAAEGVGCDACHAAAGPAPAGLAPAGAVARLDLRLDDNVKYGPLCDAEDHYFHRMGCSEVHASSSLCTACHELSRSVAGVEIPIYSEGREWREGPYAAEERPCQSCHMPETTGEVATGSRERDDRSHHGFLGSRGDLRSRALEVDVSARGAGTAIEVRVSLENRRAGHSVPSGMPGRRIVIRARALDAAGVELSRQERTLGRVLVDAHGTEVPHHEAVRVASDERIAPRETREVALALDSAAAGQIVVEVVWREMSDELAHQLEIEAPREEVLAHARLTLGPPAARRRVGRARVTRGDEG